jgi:hypothetical protein
MCPISPFPSESSVAIATRLQLKDAMSIILQAGRVGFKGRAMRCDMRRPSADLMGSFGQRRWSQRWFVWPNCLCWDRVGSCGQNAGDGFLVHGCGISDAGAERRQAPARRVGAVSELAEGTFSSRPGPTLIESISRARARTLRVGKRRIRRVDPEADGPHVNEVDLRLSGAAGEFVEVGTRPLAGQQPRPP